MKTAIRLLIFSAALFAVLPGCSLFQSIAGGESIFVVGISPAKSGLVNKVQVDSSAKLGSLMVAQGRLAMLQHGAKFQITEGLPGERYNLTVEYGGIVKASSRVVQEKLSDICWKTTLIIDDSFLKQWNKRESFSFEVKYDKQLDLNESTSISMMLRYVHGQILDRIYQEMKARGHIRDGQVIFKNLLIMEKHGKHSVHVTVMYSIREN